MKDTSILHGASSSTVYWLSNTTSAKQQRLDSVANNQIAMAQYKMYSEVDKWGNTAMPEIAIGVIVAIILTIFLIKTKRR